MPSYGWVIDIKKEWYKNVSIFFTYNILIIFSCLSFFFFFFKGQITAHVILDCIPLFTSLLHIFNNLGKSDQGLWENSPYIKTMYYLVIGLRVIAMCARLNSNKFVKVIDCFIHIICHTDGEVSCDN